MVGIVHSPIPFIYDCVQRLAGLRRVQTYAAPHLRGLEGSVLDVGAGTGLYAPLLPSSSTYVAVDVDPAKLDRLKKRCPNATTVLADGAELPFEDGRFAHALCINMTHHVSDAELEHLLDELARVVDGSVVVLDAVVADRFRSRFLWSIDRGSHPRDAETLLAALKERFDLEHVESFRVQHEYLLVVGTAPPAGMAVRRAGETQAHAVRRG